MASSAAPWLRSCAFPLVLLVVAIYAMPSFANPLTTTASSLSSIKSTALPQAPNWILPNSKGEPLSLYQIADAGKTTVMVFWSTWCKSCKTLLPKINALSQSRRARNISFVLMNLWEDSDPLAYAEQHNFTIPLVLQAEQVAQRYQIGVTPGIVVVNPAKQIIYVRPGKDDAEDVLQVLEDIIAQQRKLK